MFQIQIFDGLYHNGTVVQAPNKSLNPCSCFYLWCLKQEPHNSYWAQELTWWRHQMETFPALLALCEGNPPVTGGVTRGCDVFFDLRLNKLLNKQSRRWRFETPLRSFWRHCNGVGNTLKCKIWGNNERTLFDTKSLTFQFATYFDRKSKVIRPVLRSVLVFIRTTLC